MVHSFSYDMTWNMNDLFTPNDLICSQLPTGPTTGQTGTTQALMLTIGGPLTRRPCYPRRPQPPPQPPALPQPRQQPRSYRVVLVDKIVVDDAVIEKIEAGRVG